MGRRLRWVSSLVLFLTLFGLIFPAGALAGSNVPAASPTAVPIPPFQDVIGTSYQEDVAMLWQLGVAGGTSDTTFSPWSQVTRAQAAAFIVRALKRSGETASGPMRFTDVPATHYAANSILLADQLGIIRGTTPTTFNPDGNVTHAELATMLLRALGFESQITGEWPVSYVIKAKDVGLLTDIPFELNKEATRAETARFLVNAIFRVVSPVTGMTLSQSLHKLPVSLVIGPDTAYVSNQTVNLTASGADYFGNPIPVDDVTWSLDSGNATLSGSRLAVQNGPVTVRATSGTIAATRTYKLGKGLQVTPVSTVTRPGQSVTLSAAITSGDGTSESVTPVWKVVTGPATVAEDGTVTMTGAGTATIKATLGSFEQTASVSAGSDLAITPATPVVGVGETIAFTAGLVGAGDKTANVTWSVVSGDGTISANGLFTAGRQASIVRASTPGLNTTVTVQVINRLEITPASANLNKTESQTFSAKAYSSDGHLIADMIPKWDLSDHSLGILDDSGLFVATGSGSGQVTARYRGLTASAAVTVASDPVSLVVASSVTTIPANGASQATITAKAVDRNGITVKGSRSITFSLSNTLGSLSTTAVTTTDGVATATFTVGRAAGTTTVFASTPGLISGQALLTLVAPSVNRVVLSATPGTINADAVSTASITATLVDVSGKPTNNLTGSPISVYLTQNGAYGALVSNQINIPVGISSGSVLFRSNAYTGTVTISGSAIVPVDSITLQTAIVGLPTQLGIRPIQTTVADNSTDMVIAVEVQDKNGYLRTDGAQTITLTANGPDTLTLWPKQVVGGVATFQVHTRVAGSYTFTASSGNLTPATATGTFTAGRAAKLLLTADPVSQFSADAVSTTKLVAKVVDINNNPVTDVNPSVIFSKSSGDQVIDWNGDVTVSAQNGVATLAIKSTPFPGSTNFTASASGLTSAGPLTIKTIITGVAAKLRVQSITSAKAGGSTTVQVFVLDSLGHLVTSDNGRSVSIATNSSNVAANSPQTTVNGVATFTISDNKAEQITVTATSSGIDSDELGNTVTFLPGAAERIILVAEPAGLAANTSSRSWISAYAIDSLGNRLGSVYNVTLALSSTTLGTLSSTGIVSGSTPTAFFTPNGTTGSVTVTGTAAVPVTPITLTTYQPGTPSRVVVEATPANPTVGSTITVKVRILDTNGNTASWLNSGTNLTQVGIVADGANTAASTTTTTLSVGAYNYLLSKGFTPNGVTTGSAAIVNGEATLTFTNTRAQTVTLTPYVWYNGAPMTVTGAQVTTVHDVATQLTATPSTLLLNALTPTSANVVLTLADRYGNPVGNTDENIVASSSTSSYVNLPNGNTYTLNADGTAVVPIQSKVSGNGGTTRITFTSSKSNKQFTLPVTTDTPPDAPSVSLSNPTLANGGGYVRVYVDARTVRNAPQKVLLFVNGLQVNVYLTPSADSNNLLSEIAPGSLTAAGYIRISDLGGPGTKSLQAYLLTDLGLSPASQVFTVTVTP